MRLPKLKFKKVPISKKLGFFLLLIKFINVDVQVQRLFYASYRSY